MVLPLSEQRADGLIYLLLPVHNRRQVTEKFMRCLLAQTDQAFHLVLIDDGSTDGTAEMVRQSGVPLTVITGRGDWWWAGALQQAYAWLRPRARDGGEIVLIMNDDTHVEPGFLAAGRAALAGAPRALLLARRHSGRTGEYVDAGVTAVWSKLQFVPTRDPAQVDCFSTRGLFLRLEDFLDLGGFHPRLLPHYASDYEFTMRARRRGYRLVSDPAVRLWFDETSTGDLDPRAGSLREYLRRCFSKRFALNPLYWTTFIVLACPPAWILPNLFRVWYGFLAQLKAAASRAQAR
jgi:GT2 family glycosyltransferase